LAREVPLNNRPADGDSVERVLRSGGGGTLSQSPNKTYFRFVLAAFLLNIVSAILFISLVNRPVYDDIYNMLDVHTYAADGLSAKALLSQRNAPGPTSFLWMAIGARLAPGNELRGARLAVLASWILLATGMLLGARYSKFSAAWCASLLALLIFPHSVESTATALTEGPSLLFALLGVLAWTESTSCPKPTRSKYALAILGGLSMGIAVTCRQYFLALLPAAAIFAIYQWRKTDIREGLRWVCNIIVSLLLAALPLLLLLSVWKNISSPAVVSGASYDNAWKASVGLNLSRPATVAFYTALYLVPFTFPVMLQLKNSRRRLALPIAVLGGAGVAFFSSLFLQPGPLNSLIRFASRVPHGDTALLTLAAAVALYNAMAVGFLLWDQRQGLLPCPPALFSLFVVLLFFAEQIGVGGNLPFYDRYVLQVAPFLGIIAFSILPRLTPVRLLALAALSVLSHVMLWRFAFGG
jgi:Dolichyl-phosphate-mannose-protein mannosyltransferase